MGNRIQNCIKVFSGVVKKRIMIVGQKGSGKTTFLYANLLKPGWDKAEMLATKGFNYEEISTEDFDLKFWDI